VVIDQDRAINHIKNVQMRCFLAPRKPNGVLLETAASDASSRRHIVPGPDGAMKRWEKADMILQQIAPRNFPLPPASSPRGRSARRIVGRVDPRQAFLGKKLLRRSQPRGVFVGKRADMKFNFR
jgi:hypothetical protein